MAQPKCQSAVRGGQVATVKGAVMIGLVLALRHGIVTILQSKHRSRGCAGACVAHVISSYVGCAVFYPCWGP